MILLVFRWLNCRVLYHIISLNTTSRDLQYRRCRSIREIFHVGGNHITWGRWGQQIKISHMVWFQFSFEKSSMIEYSTIKEKNKSLMTKWYNSQEMRISSGNFSLAQTKVCHGRNTISGELFSFNSGMYTLELSCPISMLGCSESLLQSRSPFCNSLTYKVTLSWFLQHRWLARRKEDKLFLTQWGKFFRNTTNYLGFCSHIHMYIDHNGGNHLVEHTFHRISWDVYHYPLP